MKKRKALRIKEAEGYLEIEIEIGQRRQALEKVSGLLGAPTHLFLDQTVQLFLDSMVGVVIVDLGQGVDDLGAG